jgi:hypothetical protein
MKKHILFRGVLFAGVTLALACAPDTAKNNLAPEASAEIKPAPLNAKANFTIKTALREVASTNVIAKLEGSNEKLKDAYLIYTARWDHMGRDPKLQGDQIFNGAL